MYTPSWFRNDDTPTLHALMRQYSFATLVTQTDVTRAAGSDTGDAPSLFASHLPFILDAARGALGTLRAHLARPNPQWNAFAVAIGDELQAGEYDAGGYPADADRADIHGTGEAGAGGAECLVIFQGPHAYISPAWYAKQPSVPTWNYAVVHAYGTPRLLPDADLREALRDSVTFYESGFEMPWTLDALPDAYLSGMERGIVGIEIQITRLEGKFKMSQNRSEQDRAQVVAHLRRSDDPLDHDTAAMMEAGVSIVNERK